MPKKSTHRRKESRRIENSSVANYGWNFYGRFNAAYLRPGAGFHGAPPLEINKESRKERRAGNKRERREKLALDPVEISCPDICM